MAVDTLDLLTPAEALRALSLSDSHVAWSEEIEQMVTGISRTVDSLCGPVVQRTITERLHGTSGTVIALKYFPVVSITTLTEYTPSSATGQLLTAEDEDTFAGYGYLLEPDTGRVARRSNGGNATWTFGDRNIVAVYVAGRYATTAVVDRKFKNAAAVALRAEWRAAVPSRQRSSEFGEPEFVGYTSTKDIIEAVLWDDLIGHCRVAAG